jgi:hypothetical protein
MLNQSRNSKFAIIIVLIIAILVLHYSTMSKDIVKHAVYRMLFYLPLILRSFWFGFRGALGVSVAVIILYTPYGFYQWGKSSHDFHILLEGGLYVFVALILGYLLRGALYSLHNLS